MIRKAIGVFSALVLVLTGAGWWQVYRAVGGITVSDALGAWVSPHTPPAAP